MLRSFTIVLAARSLVLSLSLFAPDALAAETNPPQTDRTVSERTVSERTVSERTVSDWFDAVPNVLTKLWKLLFPAGPGDGLMSRSGGGALDDYGVESTSGGDDEYGPYADPTGGREP